MVYTWYIPTVYLVAVPDVPRHRDALDGKRSFSDHARTTRGLQNWTLCTTKHLPTRHRLRPHHRRWGRCRCCRLRRRPGRRRRCSCGGKKQVKFIALDKAFPSDYEQAAAAGKPAPALGRPGGLLGTSLRDIVCDIPGPPASRETNDLIS